MNKLTKAKLLAFTGIIIAAAVAYIYHLLPYKAIWLWAPVLVFVDYWLDWYARKRGMILSDEMTVQTTGKSAWATFQATIALLFLAIVYYDMHRASVDPRYILAYIAGFMGIVFFAVNTYYNIRQGAWD
ncbi:MAG: hypothetical protein D6733_02835 [Methanobacteriota archaeon]|nr:MAG: hypothetical protein D6733_02835 [Euryarchaeota archaeon]